MKQVTVRQWECGRKMANEKGIGFDAVQRSYEDGTFGRFLDTLKFDPTVLTPPPSARLYTVHIRFKPNREWQEAVQAAGPNTPDNYNIWKVDGQYTPTGTEEIEEDLILLNFPNGDGFDKALAWAQSKQLQNTVPREVFAIGEQHPKLHEELGQNPMYVVATKECFFEGGRSACDVWWRGSKRETDLRWVRGFGRSGGWFAFRKSALKT